VIGHGLACVRSELPTLRVFHDYFPHWPVLNARLHGQRPDKAAWQAALEESRQEAFGGIEAAEQQRWHRALLAAYGRKNVVLMAPSESAAANLKALGVPGGRKAMHVVPHAVPALISENGKEREKPDGQKPAFNVVVPGRVNAVKGRAVLERLLAEWDRHVPEARLILLGAGKQGRDFAHWPQVEIIEEYRPEELGQWLQKFSPKAALLLSQAAETFSYALSEMQQAGIPVIATDIGALGERIEEGKTGLLVSPGAVDEQARQVLAHLKTLHDNPEFQAQLSAQSRQAPQTGFASTLKTYAALWKKAGQAAAPPTDAGHASALWPRYGQRQLAELATRLHAQIGQLQQRLAASEELTEERTQWAQQLQLHIGDLQDAIAALKQGEIALRETIAEREKHIAAERAEAEHVRQVLKNEQERLHGEIRELQGELAAVYNSTSWRITKPLRFARRGLQNGLPRLRYRLKQARGMPLRLSRSVKTRGIKGTLGLIKNRLGTSADTHSLPELEHVALEKHFTPLELPLADQPVVSIVIPVYNHFEHTWNCLKSLAELSTKVPFEVIVVDDASSDETETRSADWPAASCCTPMAVCRRPAELFSATPVAGTMGGWKTRKRPNSITCGRWITVPGPASCCAENCSNNWVASTAATNRLTTKTRIWPLPCARRAIRCCINRLRRWCILKASAQAPTCLPVPSAFRPSTRKNLPKNGQQPSRSNRRRAVISNCVAYTASRRGY